MRVHADACIVSSRPGFWNGPQSALPAMKVDGTSIVRPEKICKSAA